MGGGRCCPYPDNTMELAWECKAMVLIWSIYDRHGLVYFPDDDYSVLYRSLCKNPIRP